MLICLPSSERFHFEAPRDLGWNWPLIVMLALNFGILAGVIVAAWRLLHD